jgi:hypothetical protein
MRAVAAGTRGLCAFPPIRTFIGIFAFQRGFDSVGVAV